MAETDLLQRFMCGGGGARFPAKPKEETLEHGRPENVELSLGLSLNGRFGPEPQRVMPIDNNKNNNKLFRASSVVDFANFPADVELSLYSPLTRTCSLPPETEAEWRKRKELQTFRRSEAKRKRGEKLKNVRVVKQSAPAMQFSSQGSIVSQGSGGSSGVSDFESQPCPGINKDTEVKSTTHEHSTPNQVPSKIISGFNRSRKTEASMDSPIKNTFEKSSQPVNAHLPTDMPYVSTKGDGPDGKKVQGFLYRYGKGEEVRILCICHGTFLTPAEFVKHGGGGDVDHPLRHIIVGSAFS